MRFKGHRVNDLLAQVFEEAEKDGWEFISKNSQGHFKFRNKFNHKIVAIGDSNDSRAHKNSRSQFRNLGPAKPEEEVQVPQAKPISQLAEQLSAIVAPTISPTTPTLPSISDIDNWIEGLTMPDILTHYAIAMVMLGVDNNEIASQLDRSMNWVYTRRKLVLEERYRAPFYSDDDAFVISEGQGDLSDGAKRYISRFREIGLEIINALPVFRGGKRRKDATEESAEQPHVLAESITPIEALKIAKTGYELAVIALLEAVEAVKKDGTTVKIERDNFNITFKILREETF